MSSDNQEITISIHKGNEVKKERYVLGDIYAKRPLQVEDEINQYTPEFSKYAQFITYITAKQGPHNIRYDSGIQQMISDSNYVVYDFCEGAENALPLPQIKKLESRTMTEYTKLLNTCRLFPEVQTLYRHT